MKQNCGTCAHWDRARATDAAGRVRDNRPAPCKWNGEAALPLSIHLFRPLKPDWMCKSYGDGCPCWAKYSPVSESEQP